MRPDGAPVAEIAPSEVIGYYIDVVGLFHDRIVYGYLFALRKQFREVAGFIVGIEIPGEVVHDSCDLRSIFSYLGNDRPCSPYKNPCIPVIVAGIKVCLRCGEVRLFLESTDFGDIPDSILPGAYVTVGCFRTVRGDSDSHYLFSSGRKSECLLHDGSEFICLEDKGVCRGHYYVGLGISPGDFPAGVGDARGRIARLRLGQNVVFGDFRQLLCYQVYIIYRRDDPEIPDVANRQETFYGHPDH